jgi:hypothetical protein
MLKTIQSAAGQIDQNLSGIKGTLQTTQGTINNLKSSVSNFDSGFVSPLISLVIKIKLATKC